ncbi:MAG TPA: hypothetical protein VN811_08610 [Thermoanaerobaculia bacterium]|nr:hypothetical protein [Thermoanaerobaculia bacterium]HXT51089.1 hypothetical protein [Thermoanaerobaculia bacterium]
MAQSVTDRASPALGEEESHAFYRRMMEALRAADAPFLVGGAYALAHYTGIERFTKDFDIFLQRDDLDRVEGVLAEAGCEIQRFAPHWLSKATLGDDFIDLIWSSGNGVAVVDELWFEHAPRAPVLGVPAQLCPAEEMIWSKALIMERERYDGGDVAHLIHEQAHRLDWQRLLERFDPNWRMLLVHLVQFGFVYPQRRASIPDWVMAELVRRLRVEQRQAPPRDAVCRGTLLSRNQYAIDVERWGYRDGRLPPGGNMSQREIDIWEQRRREDQGDRPVA